MNYQQTLEYIFKIPTFTQKNEPGHTREFLRRLGNPQEKFPVIHVAGSNGKGSVCAFLNSVLLKANVHVGLFTSPHLVDIRERIQVDGEPCSKECFLEAAKEVLAVVEKMQEDGLAHPSYFEFMLALAMVVFQKEGITCGILETGLGGSLDATNVVEQKILTIITSISLEHTEILGDTIEKIAAHKAGIIRPGIPVIYDGNEKDASKVIAEIAKESKSPAYEISKDKVKILLRDGKSIAFSIDNQYDDIRVCIPFPATYQAMNGALALTAVKLLEDRFSITNQAIIEGFSQVKWPGRMEEIMPEVYLDGAHNVSGIQAFLESVQDEEEPILVFSMVKEKDYKTVVRMLCGQGNWQEVILTKIDNKRALDPEELKYIFEEEKCRSMGLVTIESPKEALELALSHKKPGQKVFCVGSLYLVGQLKEVIGGQ